MPEECGSRAHLPRLFQQRVEAPLSVPLGPREPMTGSCSEILLVSGKAVGGHKKKTGADIGGIWALGSQVVGS